MIVESDERSSAALKELIVEAIGAGWTEHEVKRALFDMIQAKGYTGEEGNLWLQA